GSPVGPRRGSPGGRRSPAARPHGGKRRRPWLHTPGNYLELIKKTNTSILLCSMSPACPRVPDPPSRHRYSWQRHWCVLTTPSPTYVTNQIHHPSFSQRSARSPRPTHVGRTSLSGDTCDPAFPDVPPSRSSAP